MVERISPDSLQDLLPLAESFYAESRMPGTFEPERWLSIWTDLLSSGRAFIGVLRIEGQIIGCIGAERVEQRESQLVSYAETFWFVKAEYRCGHGISLLQWFEAESKRLGATCVAFQTMLTFPGAERAGEILARFGYTPHSITHLKVLPCL